MRGVSNVLNYWRHVTANKALVGGLFAIAAITIGTALLQQQAFAQTAACSDNDIIRCGVTSGEDFKNKMNQNTAGDLPAVYGRYGITADEVAAKAVEGNAYQDGTIRVNGRIVATDVTSLGRNKKSYSSDVAIGNKTYYESASQDVFKSDALAVLVVMDSNNQFKYAIIKECGNPAKGTPVVNEPPTKSQPPEKEPKPQTKPLYKCVSLKAIRVDEGTDDVERTYRFKATYTAANGATFQSADFDFDGNPASQNSVEPNSSDENSVTSEQVTYDTPGKKNISAALTFDVNGQTETISGEECAVSITIEKPADVTVCRDDKIVTIPENERLESDLPKDSEQCQPVPPVKERPDLPSTGPAEVITGALGFGSLAGAGYYFRTSRRNLLDSVFNTK